MSKIYSQNISFSTLKRNFKDCVYAVPQLQRNYVWDKKRVCLLLDSIYNHIPIGVSLIWKARSNKIAELKPNNKTILPTIKLNHSSIEFIIYAGVLHNAIAYSDEAIHIFFARGLTRGEQQLDEGEFLELVSHTPQALDALAASGQMTDAKTLIGLLWLSRWQRGEWALAWQAA